VVARGTSGAEGGFTIEGVVVTLFEVVVVEVVDVVDVVEFVELKAGKVKLRV
jgi:hypothetical protein